MAASDPSVEPALQRLRELRSLLLRLHKALLESERVVYEQFHGRIQSPVEFFRLVTEHEWFSWLRPISQFIVLLDEALSPKQLTTLEQINGLFAEAQALLQPVQDGTTLEKQYYRAIQRDPAIALMHADLSKMLEAGTQA